MLRIKAQFVPMDHSIKFLPSALCAPSPTQILHNRAKPLTPAWLYKIASLPRISLAIYTCISNRAHFSALTAQYHILLLESSPVITRSVQSHQMKPFTPYSRYHFPHLRPALFTTHTDLSHLVRPVVSVTEWYPSVLYKDRELRRSDHSCPILPCWAEPVRSGAKEHLSTISVPDTGCTWNRLCLGASRSAL